MTRDAQRALLYEAENEMAMVLSHGGTIDHFGSVLTVPVERRFADLTSIRTYLDKVLVFAPVAVLPRASVPVTVRERKGHRKAHYEFDAATIAIPLNRDGAWALRESVVLHELAHHLAPEPGHGPAFVAVLLYLVEHVIGPEAAHLLRVACYERGVQIGPAPA